MAKTELRQIRKEFNDVVAVEDFDLELEDGEFLVLLGPSGCGKSTTLRMIAGLEDITNGEIQVDGEIINGQKPAERDFALVFQQIALYPHLTVSDNIASPLRADKMDEERIRDRVAETAEMLNIDDLLDRKPGELSGGQQQRVAIGRALVREPRAFLLDEPFSKLDQQLRIQLQKELKRLQEQAAVTTVFVTHDQEEAMVLADRIAVMDDGKLQQVDTPENLYRRPKNEFVAEFIGNPTMNFFDVERTDGELTVDGAAYPDASVKRTAEAVRSMAARPEDITVHPGGDEGLIATVELVEMRGSTSYFVCDLDGTEITAVRQRDQMHVEEGDSVALKFDWDAVNFFDRTGELVTI